MTQMTKERSQAFATEWIADWNSHDLGRILSHYAEDFRMSSPFIARFTGDQTGTLTGKSEAGRYWSLALARLPNLKFRLLGVFHSASSICIHYESVNGLKAVEWLRFNDAGQVTEAIAHYDQSPE